MRGDWGQVWNSVDNRRKKIIGIEPAAENDGMIYSNKQGLRRSKAALGALDSVSLHVKAIRWLEEIIYQECFLK